MSQFIDLQNIVDGLLAQVIELITGVLNDLIGNLFNGILG